MTLATLLLVAFVLLLALLVLWYAVRNWVFELSPLEWGATVILSFAGGAFLVAYLLNDGWFELLAALPVIVIIAWFAIGAAISAAMRPGRSSESAED